MTDNARAIDQHRALNYLALRYPGTYNTVADCHTWDFALTGVDARPSALSSTRKVVEVILSITNRKTDFTDKFLVRVHASETSLFLLPNYGLPMTTDQL
jgi:hypothetical protein